VDPSVNQIFYSLGTTIMLATVSFTINIKGDVMKCNFLLTGVTSPDRRFCGPFHEDQRFTCTKMEIHQMLCS